MWNRGDNPVTWFNKWVLFFWALQSFRWKEIRLIDLHWKGFFLVLITRKHILPLRLSVTSHLSIIPGHMIGIFVLEYCNKTIQFLLIVLFDFLIINKSVLSKAFTCRMHFYISLFIDKCPFYLQRLFPLCIRRRLLIRPVYWIALRKETAGLKLWTVGEGHKLIIICIHLRSTPWSE